MKKYAIDVYIYIQYIYINSILYIRNNSFLFIPYIEKRIVSTNASFAIDAGDSNDMDKTIEIYDCTESDYVVVTVNCIQYYFILL